MNWHCIFVCKEIAFVKQGNLLLVISSSFSARMVIKWSLLGLFLDAPTPNSGPLPICLSALNFSCQVSDHNCRLSRSSCKTLLSAIEEILRRSLVSSANIFMTHLIQDGNSFTYNRKRSGPKTLPCGTPLNTCSSCEKFPLGPTFIDLDVRKLSNHCSSLPLIPNDFSFSISPRSETSLGAKRPGGELTKGRNVHKPVCGVLPFQAYRPCTTVLNSDECALLEQGVREYVQGVKRPRAKLTKGWNV